MTEGLELAPVNKWSDVCYGYIRVSTRDQVAGISLDAQEDKINAEAKHKNLKLIRIYADKGISGTSMNGRDELAEVLRVIRKGETLIGYSVSRISRSVDDFTRIVKDLNVRGCRLIVVAEQMDTSNAYSRCILAVLSAFAELEAEMIKERIHSAIDLKKKRKEHIGRVPYGWKLKDGKGSGLIEDPAEQAIIQKVKILVEGTNEVEGMTYTDIARKFEAEKIPRPGKSKEWGHAVVSRIYNRKDVNVKGRGEK